MSIQHSFAHWCFSELPDFDAPTFYRSCHEMGYRGVEMVPSELHAIAREAGLTIVNASGPGMTRGLNRVELHDEFLPTLARAIEETASQSVPALIIFSGNREGRPDEAGIINCARGIKEVLPLCERLEIDLLFELFNTENHVDYQADSTNYGVRLCELVNHPRLAILYDCFHMEKMGEDVLTDLRTHVRFIGHIHCATAPDRSAIINSTTLDYRDVLATCEAGGYTGFIGQEFVVPEGTLQSDALALLDDSLRLIVGTPDKP